jgi:hypothetical protein
LIQAVVQRYLHPFLWDPIITIVLQWPAWSLLGAPAAILVRTDGIVEREMTLNIDRLLRRMPLEERVYRHRCVEAGTDRRAGRSHRRRLSNRCRIDISNRAVPALQWLTLIAGE